MYSGEEFLLTKKNNTWEKKKVGAWMNQFPFPFFLLPSIITDDDTVHFLKS